MPTTEGWNDIIRKVAGTVVAAAIVGAWIFTASRASTEDVQANTDAIEAITEKQSEIRQDVAVIKGDVDNIKDDVRETKLDMKEVLKRLPVK